MRTFRVASCGDMAEQLTRGIEIQVGDIRNAEMLPSIKRMRHLALLIRRRGGGVDKLS